VPRLGWKDDESRKVPFRSKVASVAAPLIKKGPPSLPSTQQRFLAPRLSPAPHLDAPAIAATFPDIAACILCESNYLLPRGFSASLNVRSAISLTVTDKETPAPSSAPYFEFFTRSLYWSFLVGENPGALFVRAPTAVPLAIHTLPLRFLPQDAEELFPYLRHAILNDKATPILSARYLNPS